MIRAAPRLSAAEEWGLVLAAAGVPHRVESAGSVWVVLVDPADAARAQAALDAYDEEAAREPHAPLADAASRGAAWATALTVATLLLAFFAVTGSPAEGSRWFERGAASAAAIMAGEPWRAVTALTLHLDAVHVAGNALGAAVLLPPIVQRLGPGLAPFLTLLAGTAANLLGAMVQDQKHTAVGASTAIFGAIGILAALRLVPRPTATRSRWKPWVVIAASALLLALLGTGRGSDVLAHALGLAAGALLGLATAAGLRRPIGAATQGALVAASVLIVGIAWRLALSALPGR